MNASRFMLAWGLCAALAGCTRCQRPAPLPPADAPPPQTTMVLPAKPAAVTVAAGLPCEERQAVMARFGTGDYAAALNLSRTGSTRSDLSDECRAWLKEQIPVLAANVGWTQYQLEELDEAEASFRAALADRPGMVEARRGLAAVAVKRKRPAEAREAIEDYLAAAPNDSEVLWLYADTLESEKQFELAVTVLERLNAMEAPPAGLDATRINARLTAMRARLGESVRQAVMTSPRFTITYRADEHGTIVSDIAAVLETTLSEWERAFNLGFATFHRDVLLYPGERFQDLVTEGPRWAQAVYDGRLRIPVNAADEATRRERVLRHELAHAMLDEVAGARRLPGWVQEGVAQYLECENGCQNFSFGISSGEFFARERFDENFSGASAQEAPHLYRQSLFMVLLLERGVLGSGARPLGQLLQGLAALGTLDSDRFLQPLDISFATLHQAASERWRKRQGF